MGFGSTIKTVANAVLAKFNKEQARVPAGQHGGGEFVATGGEKKPWHVTMDDYERLYPKAGAVVDRDKLQALAAKFPDAIVVPVIAEEMSGRNKLPLALARQLERCGLSVETDIVQTVRAHHTGVDAPSRLLRVPQFDGPVIQGRKYIIADDVVTSGSTLAALRHHIESQGGKVVSAIAFGAAFSPQTGFGGHLAIKPETQKLLENKFDKKGLEGVLYEHGIAQSIGHLTNSQGRYIAGFGSVDAFRNRLTAAGNARVVGGNAQDGRIGKTRNATSVAEVASNARGVTPQSPALTTQLRGVSQAASELVKARPEPTLPKNLAGAKPRYGDGSRLFELEFARPVELALYIVGSRHKSRHEAAYQKWLMSVIPDVTEKDLKVTAERLRDWIRREVKSAKTDVITVTADWEKELRGDDAAVVKVFAAEFEAIEQAISAPVSKSRERLEKMDGEQAVRFFMAAPAGQVAGLMKSRQLSVKSVGLASTPAGARKIAKANQYHLPAGAPESAGGQFTTAEDAAFTKRVTDYLRTGAGSDLPLNISRHTSDVLQAVGAKDLPVVINPDVIDKAQTKHNLPLSVFANLPVELRNPIMVFDSEKEKNSLVVLTQALHNGKPVVAMVHLSKRIYLYEVNDIASVHPRDLQDFTDWKDKGLLRYRHEKLSQTWLESNDLNWPRFTEPPSGSPRTMLTERDIVNKKIQKSLVVLEIVLKRSELGDLLDTRIAKCGRWFTTKKSEAGDILTVHEVGKDAILRLSAITIRPFTGKLMEAVDISKNRLEEDLAKAAEFVAETGAVESTRIEKSDTEVLAEFVAKYDDNEARDERGRWTTSTNAPNPGTGIVAYHGTPHIVPEFSTKFIGSGEGAIAYGHGLYFAENPAVAKEYQDAGVKVSPRLRMVLDNYTNNDDAIEGIKQAIAQGTNGGKEVWQPILEEAQSLPTGHMYQVKIAVKPEELLDYDKPLREQSKHVTEALQYLADTNTKLGRSMKEVLASPNSTGEDAYKTVARFGPNKSLDDDRRYASHVLNMRGIPGIRYLDQGSRVGGSVYDAQQALDAAEKSGNKASIKAAKQGLEEAWKVPDKKTHNLVIFDDKRVHITHVNGKELSKYEALAKTKEWQAELHPRGEGGRFATTDAVVDGDDRPPQQVAGLTEADFAKGFSVPHHDYVRTDITRLVPLTIENRPYLKVEGVLTNSETQGRIGKFERMFGVDNKGKFYVDNGGLEILPGYQKEGIGTDFMNECERFYQKLGVSYVTMVANLTVGALAWSLNGYDFYDDKAREEVREFFGNAISEAHSQRKLTEGQFADDVRRISSLTHSWQFATFQTQTDPNFGRRIMLDFSKYAGGYSAKKDLDKASMGYKVGEAYQRLKIKRTAGK